MVYPGAAPRAQPHFPRWDFGFQIRGDRHCVPESKMDEEEEEDDN